MQLKINTFVVESALPEYRIVKEIITRVGVFTEIQKISPLA